MKRCCRCAEVKPSDDFYRSSQTKDGLYPYCQPCARAAKRAQVARKPEQYKASMARAKERFIARHGFERVREYQRRSSIKHREKRNEYARQRDPVARRQYQNEWLRANPDKRAARRARRRALEIGAAGSYSPADVRELLKRQRNCCAACRAQLTHYHVDHVIALAAGGSNDKTNIQLLCPTCNLSKRDMHPVDFMRQKGYLL